jgi:hypothetical protein
MMKDMKKGDLFIFLAHNHEYGVHELDSFGEKIPPQHLGHLEKNKQHTLSK